MKLRDFPTFEYMRFAKDVQNEGPFNLTCSGAPSLAPGDIDCAGIRLNTKSSYGEPELIAAIARRYKVPEEEVFLATGASGVNFMLLGAVLEPGDEVIVERPAYEILRELPLVFGARVSRFDRKPPRFRALAAAIEEMLGPRTKAVLLTNHHNPTGKRLEPEDLSELARLAGEKDFLLIVDEVYLDMVEGAATARSLRGNAIATASLTKTCGLGGLRIGWALAPREIAAAANRFHDLASVNCPAPCMDLALRAFGAIDALLGRSRGIFKANFPLVDAWVRSEEGLKWSAPDGVLFGFPRLTNGVSSTALCDLLAAEYGTHLVPGRFFDGAEDSFRIGFGTGREKLEQGLARISEAMKKIRS